MERDYRNPQDVARASQAQVEDALSREVRRGVQGRPFVLRRRFEYEGGRIGALLYIGVLSRAWADYLNENGRATDLISGVCTTGPGVGGGVVLHLDVHRGRGANDGTLLELNRVFRRLNIELVYASREDADGAESTGAPPAPGGEESPDLNADARSIRERFDAFKAAPTAEDLADLHQRIDAWRGAHERAPDATDPKTADFIERLAALLDEKGEALVAQAGG